MKVWKTENTNYFELEKRLNELQAKGVTVKQITESNNKFTIIYTVEDCCDD